MRRTTLGPVDGRLNRGGGGGMGGPAKYGTARASIGGPRPSFGAAAGRTSGAAGGAGKAAGRMSFAVAPRRSSAGLTRRSSVKAGAGGGGGGGRIVADPRPLTDKMFQNQGIRNLIKYLTEHSYDHGISPKILTHPTSKDFVNIVGFLFRQIDPTFRFPPSTAVENEIPVVFKAMRYPFGISKTGLTAVGSPHTWPALLGSLTWLIELLNYDEMAMEAAEAAEGGEGGGDGDADKMFFAYLSRAYINFINGDDEAVEELDSELEGSLGARSEAIKEETARIKAACEEVKKEIAEVTADESSLPTLKMNKANYLSDHEKFSKLIAQLQTYKENLQRKRQERKDELAAEQERLAEAQAEVERLKHRIETQELSMDDVKQMAHERDLKKQGIEAAVAQKEAMQSDVYDMEMELSKRMEALQGVLGEYHAMAGQIQVMPRNAKYAKGVDFDVTLNKAATAAGGGGVVSLPLNESILAGDIKGSIKPALKALKSEFTTQAHALRAELLEVQEGVRVSEEAVEERSSSVQEAEARLAKLEEALKREKATLEAHLAASAEEVESLESEIHALSEIARNEEDSSRDLLPSVLDSLEREAEAEVVAGVEVRRKLHDSIVTAMDQLAAHKQHMQGRIAAIQRAIEPRVTELRNAPPIVVPPPLAPISEPLVEAAPAVPATPSFASAVATSASAAATPAAPAAITPAASAKAARAEPAVEAEAEAEAAAVSTPQPRSGKKEATSTGRRSVTRSQTRSARATRSSSRKSRGSATKA